MEIQHTQFLPEDFNSFLSFNSTVVIKYVVEVTFTLSHAEIVLHCTHYARIHSHNHR